MRRHVNARRFLRSLLLIRVHTLILALLGLILLAVPVSGVRGILAEVETTYPEGSLIFNALELAGGRPLYRDVNIQPHVYTPYGPLLYIVVGIASRIIDASPQAATILARSCTALFALIATCLVAQLARAAGASSLGSTVGALLFLAASVTLKSSSFTARPDIWALAIALLALTIGLQRPRRQAIALAGFLFAVALLAKPVVFGSLLTLALVLWRVGRRLDLFLLTGIAAIVYSGCSLVLMLLAGRAYLQSFHIIISVSPRFLTPPNLLLLFVGICAPAVLLSAFAMVMSGRDDSRWPWTFLWAAALTAALTALRVGDLNHLLELSAATCVVAAIGWDRIVMKQRGRLAGVIGSISLLVVLIPQARAAAWILLHAFDPLPRLDPELVRRLKPIQTPILSRSSDIAVFLGKRPALLDPVLFSYAERLQQWDPEPLVSALRTRRVGAVILDHPLSDPDPDFQGVPIWPRGVLDAVREAYHEQARGSGWVLYVPNDLPR